MLLFSLLKFSVKKGENPSIFIKKESAILLFIFLKNLLVFPVKKRPYGSKHKIYATPPSLPKMLHLFNCYSRQDYVSSAQIPDKWLKIASKTLMDIFKKISQL